MKSAAERSQKAKSASEQRPSWRRQACLDAAGGKPLMFVDGHDDAIMGVAEVRGEPRVVYNIEAIVHELMRRDGMDREGALEFFEYNIVGARIGKRAPVFLTTLS